MKEARPRSFVWVKHNGQHFTQIIFEEPRIGCEGLTVAAEHRLDPSEYAMTLDELMARYPAPKEPK